MDPLNEEAAKRSGELCAASRTSDVVDAAVVVSAARRGDAVVTTDPRDLRRLAELVGHVPVIEL